MDKLSISLVLNTQSDIPNIQNKIDYLLEQKNNNWMFDENMSLNFLILCSILKHRPKAIDGTALAKILKTLIKLESKEGGPYFSDYTKKEISAETNIIIGCFLSMNGVELKEILKLIENTILTEDFSSDIIPSQFFLPYLISKFYKGNLTNVLKYFLLNAEPGNSLDELLILASLKNFGISKETSKVRPNSEFEKSLYSEISNYKTKRGAEENKEEENIIKMILEEFKNKSQNISPEMRNLAIKQIEKTIKGNSDKQMSLMAYYTKKALGKKGKIISNELIVKMGLANIFYWTAFIIYDDFWDEDEEANPKALPTANLFARYYSVFFSSLFKKETGFGSFFKKLIDKLDSAATWELLHCRTKIKGGIFSIPEHIPNYGNYTYKYEPTSGHILGSVAVILLAGCKINSPEILNLIEYFKNYLIAMQLNDDAHDWEEDIKRGHLSTAVVELLKDLKEKHPEKTLIDLKKDKTELRQIFWFKTVKKLCLTAIKHTQQSKKALKKISIIEDIAPLEKYINLAENCAKEALNSQEKSEQFLEEFNFN